MIVEGVVGNGGSGEMREIMIQRAVLRGQGSSVCSCRLVMW